MKNFHTLHLLSKMFIEKSAFFFFISFVLAGNYESRAMNITPNLNSSTLQIDGASTITCMPSQQTYTVSEASAIPSEDCQWVWTIEGSTFPGGKKKWLQHGKIPMPVTITWNVAGRQAGKLSLGRIYEGKTIQTGAKEVFLGIPAPLSIEVEGETLDCAGNWFEVKTEAALSGSEIIEWRIINGTDEAGHPVHFLSGTGTGATRVFLRVQNPELPLEVNARLKSSCGQITRTSARIKESFHNPPTRILGPAEVAAGQKATYDGLCRPG